MTSRIRKGPSAEYLNYNLVTENSLEHDFELENYIFHEVLS